MQLCITFFGSYTCLCFTYKDLLNNKVWISSMNWEEKKYFSICPPNHSFFFLVLLVHIEILKWRYTLYTSIIHIPVYILTYSLDRILNTSAIPLRPLPHQPRLDTSALFKKKIASAPSRSHFSPFQKTLWPLNIYTNHFGPFA